MPLDWTLRKGQPCRLLAPEGEVFTTAAEQLAVYLKRLNAAALTTDAAAPTIVLRVDPSLPGDGFRITVSEGKLHLVGQNGTPI